jgi:hypothetical protein
MSHCCCCCCCCWRCSTTAPPGPPPDAGGCHASAVSCWNSHLSRYLTQKPSSLAVYLSLLTMCVMLTKGAAGCCCCCHFPCINVISTAPSGSTPRCRRLPCRCHQLLGPHTHPVIHLPGGVCDIRHRHTAQAHAAAAPGVITGLGR